MIKKFVSRHLMLGLPAITSKINISESKASRGEFKRELAIAKERFERGVRRKTPFDPIIWTQILSVLVENARGLIMDLEKIDQWPPRWNIVFYVRYGWRARDRDMKIFEEYQKLKK